MIKTIPTTRIGTATLDRVKQCVGTLNAEKIGRNRRGSMLLSNVDWHFARGTAVLTWRVKPHSTRGFRVYNHASHRDLMRAIARCR